MNSLVIARLPRAGLGNKLFVWARALMFAKKNNLPLYIIGFNRIHIGPFLRREKAKRFYFGQFKRNSFAAQLIYLQHILTKTSIVKEPELGAEAIQFNTRYLFEQIPSWKNYFESFQSYRLIIRDAFFEKLSKKVVKQVEKYNVNAEIGVHIRMGDFKPLPDGVDFKLVGATRTPIKYFIDCIQKIGLSLNSSPKTLVFSDGYEEELKEIFTLNNTTLSDCSIDVVDLVNLSRSKIIITSAHSSFSEWAGFLSESPIIRHPDHIHSRIRLEQKLFEGTLKDFLKNHEKNSL
ncbi:alpha-1,2-fucosyltransferase [Pedobacter sp.]|uniref:alpha-1,2-fucosyltransferase n=1 Tax=Pedobacter sp. TaxID=1411316 RepID=UPI003BAAD6E2